MGQYFFTRLKSFGFFLLVNLISGVAYGQLAWNQENQKDSIAACADGFSAIYPNDVTGEILHADLDVGKKEFADIVVRDAEGKVHIVIPGKTFYKGVNPVSLSVHSLKPGKYCFRILNKAGVLYEQSFLKL